MTHHTEQERIRGYEDCHPVNQITTPGNGGTTQCGEASAERGNKKLLIGELKVPTFDPNVVGYFIPFWSAQRHYTLSEIIDYVTEEVLKRVSASNSISK